MVELRWSREGLTSASGEGQELPAHRELVPAAVTEEAALSAHMGQVGCNTESCH